MDYKFRVKRGFTYDEYKKQNFEEHIYFNDQEEEISIISYKFDRNGNNIVFKELQIEYEYIN